MLKTILKYVIIVAVVVLVVFGIVKDLFDVIGGRKDPMGVAYNGWLVVDGNKLVNANKEDIQLKGLSSHGIQWFDGLYSKENLERLKKNWGINVFRVAMYTDPDKDGYVKNHDLINKVYEIVDSAIALDMYVIVDWHILEDKDPNAHKEEAKEFFSQVAAKYADKPNVIYEICNEPNGSDVKWEENVKPYAEELIGVIREKSAKSLIIVGTPDYDRDLRPVGRSPLDAQNIMYALHFYAGSENGVLRDKIDEFREEKNLAVFVTECGITDYSGDGEVHDENFRTWIDYLNEKGISWIYWSFSNKDEGSALLKPEYTDFTIDFADYLSDTGKIVKEYFPAREE